MSLMICFTWSVNTTSTSPKISGSSSIISISSGISSSMITSSSGFSVIVIISVGVSWTVVFTVATPKSIPTD